jgi:hypothetical protein
MEKTSTLSDVIAALPAVRKAVRAEIEARVAAGDRIVYQQADGEIVDSHGSILKAAKRKAKQTRKAA